MTREVLVPTLGMALMGSEPIAALTAGHWEAAARGVFTVPTCDDCGTNYWPAVRVCYACGSVRWSWGPVPGSGRVYTYTWCDMPTHPTSQLENIALIELDGTVGEPVRVSGWVVGVDKSTLVCELPVEAGFDAIGEGIAVPYWRTRS